MWLWIYSDRRFTKHVHTMSLLMKYANLQTCFPFVFHFIDDILQTGTRSLKCVEMEIIPNFWIAENSLAPYIIKRRDCKSERVWATLRMLQWGTPSGEMEDFTLVWAKRNTKPNDRVKCSLYSCFSVACKLICFMWWFFLLYTSHVTV